MTMRMTLNPKPLAKKILVVHEDAPETTAGGIVLPDAAKEKPQHAKVLAIGPDVEHIRVGEVIVYSSFAGIPLHLEDREVVIVDEEDVLVRFEGVPSDD